MTNEEWKSAPIADLLLHTLDIHRTRHGAEPEGTCFLPQQAALRCDMGRKHMLLAFAVVRRYWNRLPAAARRTIAAWEAVEEGERERDPYGDDYVRFKDSLIRCENAAKGETALALWLVTGWWVGVKTEVAWEELPASWRPLFDDIFGDAFLSVAVDSAWLTSTVVELAQAAYAERLMPAGEVGPARLAVLADALEDAGGTDDLLSHLRSPAPHVRGCWALDLILGKQ